MGTDTHLSSHNNIFKMLKTIYANISAEWYRYIEHTHTPYMYICCRLFLSFFHFCLVNISGHTPCAGEHTVKPNQTNRNYHQHHAHRSYVCLCVAGRERQCVCSTVIVYSVVIFILFASFAFCPLSTRAIIRWWQWIEGTITTRENKKATHVCMAQRANKKPPNISHARVDNHMRVYFFRCSSLLLLLLNVFPLLRFL